MKESLPKVRGPDGSKCSAIFWETDHEFMTSDMTNLIGNMHGAAISWIIDT